MPNAIRHIAIACAVVIWNPNGSCQICCESQTVKACKFQNKCTRPQEDEKPDAKGDPNLSDPRREVSDEIK